MRLNARLFPRSDRSREALLSVVPPDRSAVTSGRWAVPVELYGLVLGSAQSAFDGGRW